MVEAVKRNELRLDDLESRVQQMALEWSEWRQRSVVVADVNISHTPHTPEPIAPPPPVPETAAPEPEVSAEPRTADKAPESAASAHESPGPPMHPGIISAPPAPLPAASGKAGRKRKPEPVRQPEKSDSEIWKMIKRYAEGSGSTDFKEIASAIDIPTEIVERLVKSNSEGF